MRIRHPLAVLGATGALAVSLLGVVVGTAQGETTTPDPDPPLLDLCVALDADVATIADLDLTAQVRAVLGDALDLTDNALDTLDVHEALVVLDCDDEDPTTTPPTPTSESPTTTPATSAPPTTSCGCPDDDDDDSNRATVINNGGDDEDEDDEDSDYFPQVAPDTGG